MARSFVCGACGAAVPDGRLACPACGEVLASVAFGGGSARVAAEPPAPTSDEDLGLPYFDDEPASSTLPSAAAYRPPSPEVPQPAAAAAPAPARAWAGAGSAAPATTMTLGGTRPTPESPGDAHEGGARGILDADWKAAELVGWLAIAGSVLAMVGFLLPWSVSVIGARGVEYFDRWGFAGPGHLLVVVGLAAVLVAAVLRERARAPIWLAIGLPGLGLGALLLGLVWPYLVGPLGAQLGVLAVTIGALLLVAAGIAAVVVDRHAPAEPAV